jgi:hypothetical protein
MLAQAARARRTAATATRRRLQTLRRDVQRDLYEDSNLRAAKTALL